MNSLSELEFRIIDELYFVTSFIDLVTVLNGDPSSIKESLEKLIQDGLIAQMLFDIRQKDFRKLDIPDISILEQSYFVASKKGLLEHNVR